MKRDGRARVGEAYVLQICGRESSSVSYERICDYSGKRVPLRGHQSNHEGNSVRHPQSLFWRNTDGRL
jgi:hypothetical protein